MLGKEKCRILKQIRQKIADENEIPYVTRECSFQGECKGTCPRCESELRYLEQQLALRASLGKRVAVAALCAGVALSAAGCGPLGSKSGSVLGNDVPPMEDLAGFIEPDPGEELEEKPSPEEYELSGEVPFPEDEDSCPTGEDPDLAGEALPETELTGDVALPEIENHG